MTRNRVHRLLENLPCLPDTNESHYNRFLELNQVYFGKTDKMIQSIRQNDRQRGGSAMILVVVVTVLLAVVGVMFVMVARVGEMASTAVVDHADLDAAVESVVSRIHSVLVEDLFGVDGRLLSGADDPDVPGPDERWDVAEHQIRDLLRPWQESIRVGPNPGPGDDVWLPGTRDDIWLASLEPVWVGDNGTPADPMDDFIWPQITDLWGTLQGRPNSLYHQRFTDVQHSFFTGNTGVRWVDPPVENFNSIVWGTLPNQVDWNRHGVSAYRVIPKIIRPNSRTGVIAENDPSLFAPFGARADASGDGVADSRWVIVPDLTTSRGKPVFAAVRIIDNCAMLNFNTGFGFYQNASDNRPWYSKPWYVSQAHVNNNLPYESNMDFGKGIGRHLSEAAYTPFLRGTDRNFVQRLMLARDPILPPTKPTQQALFPESYHSQVILNIESPGKDFLLFGIDDELEIRNRYLLTGRALSRFERENVAYETFDFGRGEYVGGWQVALRVKRIPYDGTEDIPWTVRVNPANFDDTGTPVSLFPYYYDRRHISTFYSYDRPVRTGRYPLLDIELPQEPNIRRQPREAMFRPLHHRPIDLRTLTDPFNPDRITANTLGARKNILHLLYAFRSRYLPADFDALTNENERRQLLNDAARQSAQMVVNLIDYLDADSTPTVMDRAYVRQLIREVSVSDPAIGGEIDIGATAPSIPQFLRRYEFGLGVLDPAEAVYGYERQPFISEVYCQYVPSDGGSQAFAVELVNPYDEPLVLDGWQIRLGATPHLLTGMTIPAAAGSTLGRLTLWATSSALYTVTIQTAPGQSEAISIPGLGLGTLVLGSSLYLEREDPISAGTFLTVDFVGPDLLLQLVGNNVIRSIKRDDTQWRFTNADEYLLLMLSNSGDSTLGRANGVPISVADGYQLPVANNGEPLERLTDFLKVAFVGNQKGGSSAQTITQQIGAASDESAIRLDIETMPELLDYVCFLNRPEGTLPGRININTAALHVIAAAIPPQLVMGDPDDPEHALYFAEQIVANRPYERVTDLLTKVPALQKYALPATPTVGDPFIEGDFEERDWIVSRLSNIFTVRSDTFTAYILVRLGHDGPERRMIAIFDRSQCITPRDRPRLVALHPVSDAR